MNHLTSTQVCEIAGIPQQTLDRWVQQGLLGADRREQRRRGEFHRFGLAQLLAVTAGSVYRFNGAEPGRVAGVVRFLSTYPIERLETDLATGRTFPVPAAMMRQPGEDLGLGEGFCWLPGKMSHPPAELAPGAVELLNRIGLPGIYHYARSEVAELQRRGPGKRVRRRARRQLG